MTFRSSFLYAARLLLSKGRTNGKKSMTGAVLCIALSLVPLVTVLCVSDGMIEDITKRIIGLSTQDVSVFFDSRYGEVKDAESILQTAKEFEQLEHVTGAYPEIQGTALATSLAKGSSAKRCGATVRALEKDIFSRNNSFAKLFKIIEGDTDLSNVNSAILCEKIASDLGVKSGDKISLVTAVVNENGGILPKTKIFTVNGIISSGYQELDAMWIFIPLEQGFSFLSPSCSTFCINLSTDNTFSTVPYKVKDQIHGISAFYPAWTWHEMNESQFENFSSTKILLLLVMVLIVLVASVNISSAIVMVVMERQKEIAILKSVGGSNKGIARCFVIAGTMLGASGVILGIPLGIATTMNINTILSLLERCTNLFSSIMFSISQKGMEGQYVPIKILDPAYYLQELNPSISVAKIIGTAVITVVLSAIASYFPAKKLTRNSIS